MHRSASDAPLETARVSRVAFLVLFPSSPGARRAPRRFSGDGIYASRQVLLRGGGTVSGLLERLDTDGDGELDSPPLPSPYVTIDGYVS